MKKLYFLFLLLITTSISFGQVFINEIHYENNGADVNEGFEIAGPAGLDLSGYSVVLYNGFGAGGSVYDTVNLSGIFTNQQNGFGAVWFSRSGMQNGSSDGLALVSPDGIVLQFLSYEGTTTANDGPANGMTSIDIGVSESNSTLTSESLQMDGNGVWEVAATATPNAANTNQGGATISAVFQSGLRITGVVNGPLTGLPLAIELYSSTAIADLSIYKVASQDVPGESYTFLADAISADSFIYLSSETTQFDAFFDFPPTYSVFPINLTSSAVGNIELLLNDVVIDIFAEEWGTYTDSWYYRNDGFGPNQDYVASEWADGGVNALDNTTNETSTNPFPDRTYNSTASIGKSEISGFAIYPNPVQGGSFRIMSSSQTLKSIQIYDMLGKQVINQKVMGNEIIDVNNLNAGIYILKVEEEGKLATRKLVIE